MPNLATFDLNLLVVLDMLCTERSISVAAKKLNLTQPAVSNALKRLRGSLGDELFVRTRRGIDPTPLALELAPHVKLILLDIREKLLSDSRAFSPATSQKRFRVATTDYSAVLLLPKLSLAIAQAGATVGIDLLNLSERVPFDDLDAGRIDLAIGNFAKVPPSLIQRKLYQDSLSGVMRAMHPLRSKKMSLETYAGASHVFVAPWGRLGGEVDDELSAKGLSRRIAFMVPSFSLAPEILSGTDCISTLPQRIIAHYAAPYRLKAFDVPLKLPAFTISMLWHPRTAKDNAHRWLRDLVAEASR